MICQRAAKAKRHPFYCKNRKGFTLVELLLVVTIIGMLLTFSISAWMSMKNSQQLSATATILKNASQCLESYVIHSEKIPPQSYFIAHCSHQDPWGNALVYENNGENIPITNVISKTFRDQFGDHPDAAWIITSLGPDRTRNLNSSATMWDCSTGDDLCRTVSKNTLRYELKK